MSIDRKTVDRVINFAAWARSPRGARLASCMSIEGRYRPEILRGDAEEDRRTASYAVDVRDALVVWRTITPANGFPKRWYLALSARYVMRCVGYDFVGYMRRHGVPVGRSADEHDALVYDALCATRNALERADSRLHPAPSCGTIPPVPHGHGRYPLERVSASNLEAAYD